jgi:hypothetical protein
MGNFKTPPLKLERNHKTIYTESSLVGLRLQLKPSIPNSMVKNNSTPKVLEHLESFYMEKLEKKNGTLISPHFR